MDHYSTLGVSRTATSDEIKKAYRKLAMQHHPDKGGDVKKFQDISVAYDTLSDPEKKARYDNPMPQGNPFQGFSDDPNFSFNGFNFNDLFSQAFGHRPPNQGQNGRNQQVYRTRVTVSLLDAYKRAKQILHLNTPTGVKVVDIGLPAGLISGDQVRYENVIDNATLVVEFIVLSDLKFDRKGDDLYANLPISVLDLITGTKVEFTTISGKTLEVKVRPHTQPYMQLKIPGEGMITRNGQYGDQILLLKPFIPDNIDNELIEFIERKKQNK